MEIQREQILQKFKDDLHQHPAICAFWLEGADASSTIDEYSDLDIWLDVQDGQEEAVFQTIEKLFQEKAELSKIQEENRIEVIEQGGKP